jgi:hypothetical protein
MWSGMNNRTCSSLKLICREMKYRLFHGFFGEVQAWAQSKAEEHRKKQRAFDDIILTVRTILKDQDHHLSLQKLSRHHRKIAERYSTVESTCADCPCCK